MGISAKVVISLVIFCFLKIEADLSKFGKIERLCKTKYYAKLLNDNLDKNTVEDSSLNEDYGTRENDKDYNNILKHMISNQRTIALKHLREKTLRASIEKEKVHAFKATAVESSFHGCSNDSYPHVQSGKSLESQSNNLLTSGQIHKFALDTVIRDIPTFTINLDDKPQERWKEVVRAKKDEIKRLADFFEYKFGKMLMTIVDKYLNWLHQTLPQEYLQELDGLAEASGINIGRVTLYNVFYEFFSVCTSVVMEGEDGRMYHGRNLDFGLLMGWDSQNHTWYVAELLRPLIIKLEFVKNGEPLYSAVSYAGYTGILTGLKKNAFSLTIDERFILNGGYVGIAEWIIGQRDASWLGLLTRQVMESANSYMQAKQTLTETKLVAPAYFILAGNSSHQGCVVTRSRSDADVWELGASTADRWYVLETNYDHWRSTPFYDQRRQYATQCMDQLGRQQPLDTLYKVLSTRPVLNKETTLTALMDVTAGTLLVWPRECPDPCWPF